MAITLKAFASKCTVHNQGKSAQALEHSREKQVLGTQSKETGHYHKSVILLKGNAISIAASEKS